MDLAAWEWVASKAFSSACIDAGECKGARVPSRPPPEDHIGRMADITTGRGQSTRPRPYEMLGGMDRTAPELRLVVTVADFDRALAIYRDALGLLQVEDYSTPTSRAVVLDAGRATIELADAAHAESVDELEVGHRSAGTIRLAFEVADTYAATRGALAAGAALVAGPVVTPWETSSSRLESGEGFQLTLFGPVPT
jgi:catechol 2,3-dioxygenase-like lactoylglutathione lyase family enzyme